MSTIGMSSDINFEHDLKPINRRPLSACRGATILGGSRLLHPQGVRLMSLFWGGTFDKDHIEHATALLAGEAGVRHRPDGAFL